MHDDFIHKGYYHRHPSTTDPQMFPWMFQQCTSPNVPQISLKNDHGNNSGLFKPKARHTSLHRWPHQKHSEDKVWTSRGTIFGQIYWNGILHQIIIYITLHISFAFGIISLQWHISNYILWVLYHCILHVWYSVYFIHIFHILYQLSHMMIYYIHEV